MQSPKAYVMDTDISRNVVLSPEYANEIRSDPRLSFGKSIAKVGGLAFICEKSPY